LIEGQDGIWLMLRENIVLPGEVVLEDIKLQAKLEIDEEISKKSFCQGKLHINLLWREGLLIDKRTNEDEEGIVHRSFLIEPLDGGREALTKEPKPFGASRFPGYVWQGEPLLRQQEGWQRHELSWPWQANGGNDLEVCRAELVCLHGVRTGLRTVLLEALLKVPYVENDYDNWSGRIWLKQEDLVLDLVDDAVLEVLGISFKDGMMQMGFNRDTRCLQLQWLCQITIFYLRIPGGGARLGAATIYQNKSAFLPTVNVLKQGVLSFNPARREVVIRIHKPERLLCRFGLFLKVKTENMAGLL
jgi:hypothetical protein